MIAVGLAGGRSVGSSGWVAACLFVPGLVLFLDLSQLGAEATSLLAIVFVGVVGAWRQQATATSACGTAFCWAALPAGVVAGAVLANELGDRALELSFAGLQLVFAAQLVRRASRPMRSHADANG